MKKSRKAKVFYTLQDAYGKDVNIDLNNYRVICNKTGKRKSFYHKYLHNLIQRKYEGNIDRFRTEYVSREAAPDKNERSESTRLNSSHITISYAVFCLKKKKKQQNKKKKHKNKKKKTDDSKTRQNT